MDQNYSNEILKIVLSTNSQKFFSWYKMEEKSSKTKKKHQNLKKENIAKTEKKYTNNKNYQHLKKKLIKSAKLYISRIKKNHQNRVKSSLKFKKLVFVLIFLLSFY